MNIKSLTLFKSAAAALLVLACALPLLGAPAPALAADSAGDVTASLRPLSPMPRPMHMPEGTALKKIQDRGRLIVGVNQDTLLFGYLNPLTNQLEGFDIDIARQVAKAIFGDENRIQFKAVVSASRIPVVLDGSVDMVISTMTINAARKEQIAFSEVYYLAGQKVLVKRDSKARSIADLSGQTVCVPKGSTTAKNIPALNPKALLNEVDTFTDCLVLFQMGQVDAISSDDVVLAGLAKQDPYAKVIGERLTDEPYGIGMSKDSPDFVRFVNGVIVQLKSDGTWAQIYDKWLGAFGNAPTPPRGTYNN
jgi:polar amino acid transport system substrate-binding protein